MLYMAAKNFDIDNDVKVRAGIDVVDVSTWAPDRVESMLANRFLMKTDKKTPTVQVAKAKATPKTSAENQLTRSRRVSPLARRERVFKTRLAKQGD